MKRLLLVIGILGLSGCVYHSPYGYSRYSTVTPVYPHYERVVPVYPRYERHYSVPIPPSRSYSYEYREHRPHFQRHNHRW